MYADLPPERVGRAASASLIEQREGLKQLAATQLVKREVPIRRCVVGGVPCIEVGVAQSTATILHVHGGGFRMGEVEIWHGFASRVALATGATVLVPDYRLAPEHPFPNGLRDLFAVYRELVRQTDNVFISGDSAGGGLACSLCLAIRDNGLAAPLRGLVLLSPWLDLTLSSDTYERCASTDPVFSRAEAVAAASDYLQDWPSDDPLVSPLLADLAGLPPTLLFAGAGEVLSGEAYQLQKRLADCGIDVVAHFEPDMPHVWLILAPSAPQTESGIAAIGNFVQDAHRQVQ